jgi:hypothetical protein
MKTHPSKIFPAWESQIRKILANPGGSMLFPMHVVHYTARDGSNRFRAFDIMLHEDKTVTFGETRVDGTEPENAISGQDVTMYIHFHMDGDRKDSTLEKALAEFAEQEGLSDLTQTGETFTVAQLQSQMIEVVRQLIKETAN